MRPHFDAFAFIFFCCKNRKMPLHTFEHVESDTTAELPFLKYKCKLQNISNHAKYAYIRFDTIDMKPHEWFPRVETLIVQQPSTYTRLEMDGFQLSTWMLLVLGSKLPGLHMDADGSRLYIPIPLSGFLSDFKEHPIEVEIYYNNFLDDDDRTVIQIIAVPDKQTFTSAIQFSDLNVENLDTDKQTIDLDLSQSVPETRRVKSVVFYLPKAGMWLRSGELLLDGKQVHHFENLYDALVMDKLGFDMLVPKMPLLTMSFTNWATDKASNALYLNTLSPS